MQDMTPSMPGPPGARFMGSRACLCNTLRSLNHGAKRGLTRLTSYLLDGMGLSYGAPLKRTTDPVALRGSRLGGHIANEESRLSAGVRHRVQSEWGTPARGIAGKLTEAAGRMAAAGRM